MHFRKKACFTHTLEVQEEVLSFSDCSRLKKKKKANLLLVCSTYFTSWHCWRLNWILIRRRWSSENLFILEQLKYYREIEIEKHSILKANCFVNTSQKCMINILYVTYSVCKAIDRKINEDRKLIIYNKIICIQFLT